MEGKSCPHDGNRLGYLGGSYGNQRVNLSFFHCRRCDTVFAILKRVGARPATVLQWRRTDTAGLRLLDQSNLSIWDTLPPGFRRGVESQLLFNLEQLAISPSPPVLRGRGQG